MATTTVSCRGENSVLHRDVRPWSGQHRLAIRRLITGGAPAQRPCPLEQRLQRAASRTGCLPGCAECEDRILYIRQVEGVCASRVRKATSATPTS